MISYSDSLIENTTIHNVRRCHNTRPSTEIISSHSLTILYMSMLHD